MGPIMRFAAAKLKSLVSIPVAVFVMMSITAMAADGHRLHRPVATHSIVARHAVTGEYSIAEYCDHLGDSYSVQANMMLKPTV